ncbi:hypothetical protein D3C86_715240 [compost metagenome]
MFLLGFDPHLGGHEVLFQAVKHRTQRAEVPDMRNRGRQRGVAAGRADRAVKGAVVDAGGFGQRHALVGAADRRDLRWRRLLRGQRGAFRFDQQTGLQQVEGADVGGFDPIGRSLRLARLLVLAVLARLTDEYARAHADLDIALDFQRDQRFPHRCAAHLQLLGQFALGGQSAARGKVARLDARGDLVGNHAIEAGGGYGLKRCHCWTG